MRTDRLIILLLLAACKATTPSSSVNYSEDLSVHRPKMETSTTEKQGNEAIKKEEYRPMTGHIQSELDSINRISIELNKAGKYIDGFVIQVYLGDSRDIANQARSRMDEFFPELDAKVSYRQPNFRVKAGRFADRLRANRIHQQVKEEFPRAILLPERFLQKYE